MKISNRTSGTFSKLVALILVVTLSCSVLPVVAHGNYIAGEPQSEVQSLPLWGDVDNDGELTLNDASLIREFLARGAEIDIDLDIADFNRDGIVTLHDVLLIQREVAQAALRFPAPNAGIDFVNENLTGLVYNAQHTIAGVNRTADAQGLVPIDAAWFGQNVSVVRAAFGENTASLPQYLAIPQRPSTPQPTATRTDPDLDNGTITNVNDTMEWRASTAASWQNVAQGATTITDLAAGSYQVRVRAVSGASFASAAANVTVFQVRPPVDQSRSVLIDFENFNLGAWTQFTRGDSDPIITVVADPAAPGERSMQVVVRGHNQAPIIPAYLPFALEEYATISLRIRMQTGTLTGNNFQVFASHSSAEAGNFVRWGFGNNASAGHQFANLRIATSAENSFTSSDWTYITATINTTASTANLQGNIYLALGINTNTNATFMIDDIVLTLCDSFTMPEPGYCVPMPTLYSVTPRTITVNEITPPPTGQSVQFGINTVNYPPTQWQTSRTFSGLTPNTRYYVFARSAANDYFIAGHPSEPLTVTTLQDEPIVVPVNGAAETGEYRNLFVEFEIATQEEVDARLQQTWYRLFECSILMDGTPPPHNHRYRLFYVMPNDPTMGYILDSGGGMENSADVRSEGMSYGMMLAVQMDEQEIFDKLWRWTYNYMWHPYDRSQPLTGRGNNASWGYFAWRLIVNPNGTVTIADGAPAPDGEIFFITALLFASHRWGDGDGVLDYGRHARQIMFDIINRTGLPQGDNHRPLFNLQNHLPVMSTMGPMQNHSNHSYIVAHFFDIWAEEIEYDYRHWDIWGGEAAALANAEFFREAARKGREFLATTIPPQHGLAPERVHFDGTPIPCATGHLGLWVDAWRVAGNIAMDNAWWGRNQPFATQHAHTMQSWLARPEFNERPGGRFTYPSAFFIDGQPAFAKAPDTSPGFVGNNAVASLSATHDLARDFVQHFWETNMTPGRWRYFDGCLYFFSLLSLSGNYRAWFNTGALRPDTDTLNVRLSAQRANFDKAVPQNITLDAFWNGNTLASVYWGGTALTEGADFTADANSVTLNNSFLQGLPIGSATVFFNFNGGSVARRLTITVDDTALPVLGYTFHQPPRLPFNQTGAHGQGNVEITFPGGNPPVMRVNKTGGHSDNGFAVTLRLPVGVDLSQFPNLYIRMRTASGLSHNNLRVAVAPGGAPLAALGAMTPIGNLSNHHFGGMTDFTDLQIPISGSNLTGDVQIAVGMLNAPAHTIEIAYIGLVPYDELADPSATISPSTAYFDLHVPTEVVVNVAWNGNTLTQIHRNGTPLLPATDFTVVANQITISPAFLQYLAQGVTVLTFEFSAGRSSTLTINVTDSSIQDSAIYPAYANFDKANPTDIVVDITLNGNNFMGIDGVTAGNGFRVYDNGAQVVFNSAYLISRDNGPAVFTFRFSAGQNATFTINISDSTPLTVPRYYTFDTDKTPLFSFNQNAHANTSVTWLPTGANNEPGVIQVVARNRGDMIVIPFDLGALTLGDFESIRIRLAAVAGDSTHKPFGVVATATGEFPHVIENAANTRIATSAGNILTNTNAWSTHTIALNPGALSHLTGIVYLGFGIPAHHNPDNPATFQISEIELIMRPGAIPNAVLTPNTATFDVAHPADISVEMELNGNTLDRITDGPESLLQDLDFTISGNTVTFCRYIIAGWGLGTTTLLFHFAPGENRTLTISIIDSNEPPPPPPPALVIRHTFEQPLDGVRPTPYTNVGQSASASFPGGDVMRITKVGGHSTHGVIIPFDLGTTTLADYSHFRIQTRPGATPGDLGHKQFHVEVMAGHDALFTGFGNNAANRLIPLAQFNFNDNPLTINQAIRPEVGSLTGEISIAIGLNSATAHNLDIIVIELVPIPTGATAVLGASVLVADNNPAISIHVPTTANRGDYVTAYFYLDENPGVNFAGFNVTFDPDVLSPMLLSENNLYAGHPASGALGGLVFDGGRYHPAPQSPATISFTAPSNTNATGRLGFIRFKVATEAALEATTIRAEHGVAANAAWDIFDISDATATITIEGVYCNCIHCQNCNCEVSAYGAFSGVTGAPWRLYYCGMLVVDGGHISNAGAFGPWHTHRADISEIAFTAEITAGASVQRMFEGMTNLTELDLSAWDTSGATSMSNMFYGAVSLRQLTLGEHFRFGNDNPALPPITQNATHSGRWQNVGTGTAQNPQGLHAFTSDELVQFYRTQGISDTWVWQAAAPEIHPDSLIVILDLNNGNFTGLPPGIVFVTPPALGLASPPALVVAPGDSVGILPIMPTAAVPAAITRDGYRFTGWHEIVDGEYIRRTDNFIPQEHTTLVARWEEIPRDTDFIVGNVNGDNRITSADATMIARWLAGQTVPDFCSLAADINGDGCVTVADVLLLARWLAGHNVSHLIAH
ncbi:MAG: glycosyl hydrolase family 8 [Defluviitaleaceae bacterium]|nr:glycosyl hydrolase family 8 [Defluviitaleaceae bacterium]MCL2262636.1 glycosyl hydrolase family 8 [Defluviitaleaceae bacterium]